MSLVSRFLRYVSFATASSTQTGAVPSTEGQLLFARALADELRAIGLSEVELDRNGYLMATLPANSAAALPVIGFIAHLDTSPDASGENVQPRVVTNYDGADIVLNAEENIVLSVTDFPELTNYVGQDIVVANGKTLLGADDKAGIAEIVSAMEYFIAHPEIVHGKIRIAFTPDEEIGQGAAHFDVEKFAADWAYTVDGGAIGELEYENFNAAEATVRIKGRNIHPGYAKGKMINSLLVANRFIAQLPAAETPENTDGREGFFHLTEMNGTVEETVLQIIIRDHGSERFEQRKQLLRDIAKRIGDSIISVEIRDQYRNMREKIEPVMYIVELAEQAMREVGVEPLVKPIRGGTDGAQLSFKGLPCPNIFAGGHNFHGRYEFVPVQSMQKAMEVIIRIVENNAQID
ncbi:MAG: peptidase T [Prevotellaceae bacterium]|jgi:tripeptide aminopeptidase|nr:peptidase T [Prevotellaceae bacterium]